MDMRIWGRIVCFLKGKHRRRKRKNEPLGRGEYLECPRCGRVKSCKAKVTK